MLELNFLELTKGAWKVGFGKAFEKAGRLGFGNSGLSRRKPGRGADGEPHVHAAAEGGHGKLWIEPQEGT